MRRFNPALAGLILAGVIEQLYCSLVVGEPDILRAVKPLKKRHGFDTGLIAARRTDVLFRGHDVEDFAVWTHIFGVVSEHVCAKLVEGKRVEQSHARSVSKLSVRLPADKVTVF